MLPNFLKFVKKVSGKDLSTNDFTNDYKNKLDGIAEGANKTLVNDTLTSTSTTEALSAKQGKILSEKIKINIVTGQEVATNEYIDGKQVFVKRISTGSLPVNAQNEVTTGLSNVTCVRLLGMVYDSSGNAFPLPFSYTTDSNNIGLIFLKAISKVRIATGIDRSPLSGYIDIYYTKDN